MRLSAAILAMWCALIPALVYAEAGPRIQFVDKEHDFGDVIHGMAPSFDFSYTNTGDADLVVDRVASSCGCTRAIRGKPTLAAGESAKIHTQIDTFGMASGKHTKTVVVHSNDPENPATALKLRFNVIRYVTLRPESLSTWLPAWDKPAIFVVSATNNGKAPVTLKAATADPPIEVVLDPEEVTVDPGGKTDFRIKVTVSQQSAKPYLSGKLYIDSSARLQKTLSLKYLIYLPKTDGK